MIELNCETVSAARKKLASKATQEEGVRMLKAMKKITERYQWRARAMTSCCVNLDPYCRKFGQKIELLDQAIKMLESGNLSESDSLLDRLQKQIASEMVAPPEISHKIEPSRCQS